MKFEFNSADHEIPQFENVPPGWYHATVTQVDYPVAPKSGGNDMLVVTFEVDAAEHPEWANRRITKYLCVHHEKRETAQIANGQLAKILLASGIPTMKDTTDLLGAQLQIRVKMGKPSGDFEARSEWADCKAKGAAAPAPARKANSEPDEPVPAPQPRGAKPAWKK